MDERLEKAKDIARAYGQEHLISLLETQENKEELAKQTIDTDFEQIKELYEATKKVPEIEEKSIEYITYVDKYKISQEQREHYEQLGKQIIEKGKYAVVTMAGGQGTRLGHSGPKGTFLIEVEPEQKYLFQILAESLKDTNKQYHIDLPWYIMTSTENHEQTTNFFEEHHYFDYPKEMIRFFKQGDLPLVDTNGKVLIGENHLIKEAADGNGCIYQAMKKNGILEDMKNKNIEWIFIGSVDNVLLNMTDPVLLGLTIDQNNKIGSKSVAKISPKERVGVFCKRNRVPTVIEYTELPEEMAEETDENGELLFGESHIMCNLFHIDALELISKQKLPYHSAFKKVPYMNEKGELIKPEEPNAYKFEAFIFDAFNFFENLSILRGKREEDFAPVKNKEGVDSQETARKLYNAYKNR